MKFLQNDMDLQNHKKVLKYHKKANNNQPLYRVLFP